MPDRSVSFSLKNMSFTMYVSLLLSLKNAPYLSESYSLNKSKKDFKDQETIQSSTTPDPGYHMKK